MVRRPNTKVAMLHRPDPSLSFFFWILPFSSPHTVGKKSGALVGFSGGPTCRKEATEKTDAGAGLSHASLDLAS
jgi:hypothetical protein